MNFNFNTAMLSSYGRSVLAGGLTLYMAGVTDPADLWKALLAGIVPVALRALNPKDSGFGKIPTVQEVEESVKVAVKETLETPKSKPATMKTAAKKTTKKPAEKPKQ